MHRRACGVNAVLPLRQLFPPPFSQSMSTHISQYSIRSQLTKPPSVQVASKSFQRETSKLLKRSSCTARKLVADALSTRAHDDGRATARKATLTVGVAMAFYPQKVEIDCILFEGHSSAQKRNAAIIPTLCARMYRACLGKLLPSGRRRRRTIPTPDPRRSPFQAVYDLLRVDFLSFFKLQRRFIFWFKKVFTILTRTFNNYKNEVHIPAARSMLLSYPQSCTSVR